MASRRRGNESTSRAGRIIGWAFVLSCVFSAGLIVGLQLNGDPRSWLVSTAESEANAAASPADTNDKKESTIFSFYEELSGGKPPEASTTAKAKAAEEKNATGSSRESSDQTGDKASDSALYTVQVSAFPDLAKAERELEELVAKGLDPHVVATPTKDDETFYRLRIGRYSSLDGAESARDRLADRLDSQPVVTVF